MTDNKKTNPQELADSQLDEATGGINLGSDFQRLKPIATVTNFNDGEVASKFVLASASGSGNVLGGNPEGATEYTFEEDLGDDIIPVTYKLNN